MSNYIEQQLRIEKAAKNQAYAFIIASGLYNKFVEFCAKFDYIDDWHGMAAALLEEQAKKAKEAEKGGEVWARRFLSAG